MRLRWHTTNTTRWSTEPMYPGRYGSPTHTVKRTDTVTVLQYEDALGNWHDIPTETTTIDETNGESFPPLSPAIQAAADAFAKRKDAAEILTQFTTPPVVP